MDFYNGTMIKILTTNLCRNMTDIFKLLFSNINRKHILTTVLVMSTSLLCHCYCVIFWRLAKTLIAFMFMYTVLSIVSTFINCLNNTFFNNENKVIGLSYYYINSKVNIQLYPFSPDWILDVHYVLILTHIFTCLQTYIHFFPRYSWRRYVYFVGVCDKMHVHVAWDRFSLGCLPTPEVFNISN